MADSPWSPWGGCKTRSDSVASLARQAEKEKYWRQSLEAAAKPRAAKGHFKKAAEKTFPQRPVAERAQRNEEVSEERFQKHKEETKGAIAALEDQHKRAMQGLQAKLESKDKEIRTLKAITRQCSTLSVKTIDRRSHRSNQTEVGQTARRPA
jgi:metal-responsive CopG/Arc/MetJ family transcriptional regulator